MKAAWYDRVGPAAEVLQVGDLPAPECGPGEVLVRVATSGVNPSDVKSRAGLRRGMPFPRVIPHSDGGGVIEAVGEGVPASRVGERVWLWNSAWQRPFGTCAQYVALPAAQAVPLPAGTDFLAAACLGIPAMTAHRCLFADGPLTGRTVLVMGGAGAVGHYAVQLARWGGARVIATVSGPDKAAHAAAGGAEVVINYRTEDVAAAVLDATGGAGVDHVVDVEFGGNLPVTSKVIKASGVIAAYGSFAVPEPVVPAAALLLNDVTIRLVLVYRLTPAARAQAIADLTAALEQGALDHAIAAVRPLAEVAGAHQDVESGRLIGNVVVTLD